MSELLCPDCTESGICKLKVYITRMAMTQAQIEEQMKSCTQDKAQLRDDFIMQDGIHTGNVRNAMEKIIGIANSEQ